MTISNLASDVAKKLNRHAPTILTVLAGVGTVATAVLFARAGMQAERAVQHEVRVNEVYEHRYPTYTETAGITWHYYLIPSSIAIATGVSFICANALNQNRQAALIGAYAIAERTWAQYRDKVQEMAGVHGESIIRTETVKDMAQNTVVDPRFFGREHDGDLYLDIFSGQQFISDEQSIRKAMDDTNEKCEEDGFASLNYFHDRIGARTTQLGEIMGWSDGFPLDIIITEIQFEDGTKGFALDYARLPFMGYHEV
jgi:hypothetical protein